MFVNIIMKLNLCIFILEKNKYFDILFTHSLDAVHTHQDIIACTDDMRSVAHMYI